MPKKDSNFLRRAVQRRQAAVTMAQAVLQRTDRWEVVFLAQALAASQQAEIDDMRAMLRERGAPLLNRSKRHPRQV